MARHSLARKKRSLLGFSLDCRSALHFCMLLTRPPWLGIPWQERKALLRGFSWDCRSALHFCMLLSRPPWLSIPWQERKICKQSCSFKSYVYKQGKIRICKHSSLCQKCHAELDSASPKLDQNMPLSDPPAKSRFFRIPCCILLKKIYVNFYVFNF